MNQKGMEMNYPRIHLTVDNCFASKRWAKPSEWTDILISLGINNIEASADNECDPLYSDKTYLKDWISDVKSNINSKNIYIRNFYSGHGTYSTLGLAHYDKRVRDRLLNKWLKPLIDIASNFNAGVGFFCHAFNDSVLQNPNQYIKTKDDLIGSLADLATYAHKCGVSPIGIEQMYTPHQIPWTIVGTKQLIKDIFSRSGHPFYCTIDTGHQSGQIQFLLPNHEDILKACKGSTDIWLGPSACYEIIDQVRKQEMPIDIAIKKIEKLIEEYSYLFASKKDANTYQWLRELGCYSPIIHLQQTNGNSSSHLSFTSCNNAKGKINAKEVLEAIAYSYVNCNEKDMPSKCSDIYLTLELFFDTSEKNSDILSQLKESIDYWRQYIHKDGLSLDQLI